MNVKKYIKIISLSAMTFLFASVIAAQDAKPADAPPPDAQRQSMKRMQDDHADFLHRLGLSEEQFQQIRKLHQEKKPLMEAAQKRLREASRALNEAMYADQANDADVQARINDLQAARSEVEKLRFTTEYAVRRLLTQEQLVRFRELRQQFERMRQDIETRRRDMGNRPLNRQRQGNQPQPAKPAAPPDQPRQDI